MYESLRNPNGRYMNSAQAAEVREELKTTIYDIPEATEIGADHEWEVCDSMDVTSVPGDDAPIDLTEQEGFHI